MEAHQDLPNLFMRVLKLCLFCCEALRYVFSDVEKVIILQGKSEIDDKNTSF